MRYPRDMATDTTTGSDSTLKQRYQQVRDRIDQAAARVGRRGSDVLLVVVTKNAGIEAIRELMTLGHADFGENRIANMAARAAQIQEYIDRIRELPRVAGRPIPEPPRWHMIGRMQRNKVRKTVDTSRLIHSVDSMRLVEEIQAQAVKQGRVAEVLIQVNASGETNKGGIQPAAVSHVIDQINTMLNVRPRGMMCMAPHTDDTDVIRSVFTRCQEIYEEVRKENTGGKRFDILSMGMSNDFEIAVECGANLVRVGSAVIGEGTKPEAQEEDHEIE